MSQQQSGEPMQGQEPGPSRPLPQAFPFSQPQYPPQQPPGGAPPPWWPQPPRRGRAWLIWLILFLASGALFMLACAGLINIAVKAGGDRPVYQTRTVQEGKGDKIIAVVQLHDVVDDSMARFAARVLEELAKDKKVVAVVLRVDTPGGTVSASDQIYHSIMRFRKDSGNKPVIISQGGYATSGGYYISVAGEYIFAEHVTITANIGVIMFMLNVRQGLEEKLGVRPIVITSRHTPFKDALSPFKDMTTTQADYVQGLIESAYERFVEVVADGRPALKAQGRERLLALADGKALTADQALKAGLVDQIGYVEDAWEYAARKAGVSQPKVVVYSPRPSSLGDLLMSRSSVPALEKFEDPLRHAQGLLAPRLLYLYHDDYLVKGWPATDSAGQ